ncbi:hypothetical protein [Nocardia australiensis]|uniref:hypothetical protein n=1 Tax=Nocardia australiensis TaxID=2887191 RepID=UPI001D132B12|nr:hypothetical protein [Nocardia australiensis]
MSSISTPSTMRSASAPQCSDAAVPEVGVRHHRVQQGSSRSRRGVQGDREEAHLAQVREAAGDDLSAWIARACLARLLSAAARTSREWELAHPEQAAAARAQDAVRALEAEAEREITDHAHALADSRGHNTAPTTADYLAAHRHVRELLDRAEEQLRRG